ncbi:MAG: helix-turn-helix domain-containing protein [Oscillospiraceae bacterium]
MADGIAATPISRIAEAAGLTPTSLYRYFRNKDALVFAAWRDALATFFCRFHGAVYPRGRVLQERV